MWKSAEKAPEAAETLGITANRLKTLGLIDKIVSEPLGGAHRDPNAVFTTLRRALQEALSQVQEKPLEDLLVARFNKVMDYGKYKEVAER